MGQHFLGSANVGDEDIFSLSLSLSSQTLLLYLSLPRQFPHHVIYSSAKDKKMRSARQSCSRAFPSFDSIDPARQENKLEEGREKLRKGEKVFLNER